MIDSYWCIGWFVNFSLMVIVVKCLLNPMPETINGGILWVKSLETRWLTGLKKGWLGRSISLDLLNMIQMSDVKKTSKRHISLNIHWFCCGPKPCIFGEDQDMWIHVNGRFFHSQWWLTCFDPVITDISIVSMEVGEPQFQGNT